MADATISTTTPSPTPTPSATPPMVPLTVEEYQRLRGLEGQLAEFQKSQAAALEAKEAERLKALADKGQIEQALAEQRKSWETKHTEAVTRYSQLESTVFAASKAAALSDALAGRVFVGETPEAKASAAGMVRQLLAEQFEATRDASGAFVVREKVTGRPAADVLKERLESPQFAIFFAPGKSGGSGADGTRPGATSTSTEPGSLAAIASDWRNRQTQYQSFGLRGTPSK